MAKMLKKFEVEAYLDSWMDNVGAPFGLRMALINALRDEPSLTDWFGSADIDYDEDHAVSFMVKNYGDDYEY